MSIDDRFLAWWNEEIVGYLDGQELLLCDEERRTAYSAALLAYRQGLKQQKQFLESCHKRNSGGTHKWKKEFARFCKGLDTQEPLRTRVELLRRFAHEARGDSVRYGKEDRIRAQALAHALQKDAGGHEGTAPPSTGAEPRDVKCEEHVGGPEACQDCCYWARLLARAEWGQCRHSPPVKINTEEESLDNRWPSTHERDWCGAFSDE